jgi:hypothetical protein
MCRYRRVAVERKSSAPTPRAVAKSGYLHLFGVALATHQFLVMQFAVFHSHGEQRRPERSNRL